MILEFYSENFYLFGLLCVLVLAVLIQILYHWIVYARLAFSKSKIEDRANQEGVSVIIFSRNQYEDLVQRLSLFLEQDYPLFEVIVVNFESEDQTQELLQQLSYTRAKLKYVTMEKDYNFYAGKKFPISIAIRIAQYDICLFTDASYEPKSPLWIQKMAAQFNSSVEIVLGYSTYPKNNSLLSRFIRFDNLRLAMNYFGFAMAKMPFTGIGTNFAYRKSLFFKHNGLISSYRAVTAGEDDTFINKAANSTNTRCEFDSASFMLASRNMYFSDWFLLKNQYYLSSKHYNAKHRFWLFIASFTRFLIYGLSITLLAFWFAPFVALGAFSIYLISQLIVYSFVIKRLKEKISVLWAPLFEIFLMFLHFFMVLKNLFYKRGA